MSLIPEELKYTKSHEWVRIEDNNIVVVGITEHAQELLGDLVFVELPEVDDEVAINEECAVVESVKAASDVYSPVDGEIVEVNSILPDKPELVNSDPYGEGWLFKVKLAGKLDHLLTAEEYKASWDEEH